MTTLVWCGTVYACQVSADTLEQLGLTVHAHPADDTWLVSCPEPVAEFLQSHPLRWSWNLLPRYCFGSVPSPVFPVPDAVLAGIPTWVTDPPCLPPVPLSLLPASLPDSVPCPACAGTGLFTENVQAPARHADPGVLDGETADADLHLLAATDGDPVMPADLRPQPAPRPWAWLHRLVPPFHRLAAHRSL